MKRCQNATVSEQEINQVRDQAREFLDALINIEFAMTLEEHQGLFSIIRNLEFETWGHRGEFVDRPEKTATSQRLRRLLAEIRP
jgi:hypothetical protein